MYVGGMLARNIVCVTLLYVLRFFRCASLPIVIMEQRDSKGGTWALWSLLCWHCSCSSGLSQPGTMLTAKFRWYTDSASILPVKKRCAFWASSIVVMQSSISAMLSMKLSNTAVCVQAAHRTYGKCPSFRDGIPNTCGETTPSWMQICGGPSCCTDTSPATECGSECATVGERDSAAV